MDSTMNFAISAAAPIEEISNALYSKGIKFMVTHNVDVKLPEIVFDGATFRISPRSIEGNGIIAKLEYVPKTEIEARSDDDSRFFKKIKKISELELASNRRRHFHTFVNFCREILPTKGGVGGDCYRRAHQNNQNQGFLAATAAGKTRTRFSRQ